MIDISESIKPKGGLEPNQPLPYERSTPPIVLFGQYIVPDTGFEPVTLCV